MKSRIKKRSLVIGGHKTSVSLEEAFWTELKASAKGRGITVAELVEEIDRQRDFTNLSSAIRLFVLAECQARAEPAVGLVPDERAGFGGAAY